MQTLKVVPMYANGRMQDQNERHGKPIAYEVHDVTDEYATRFPVVIESDGTRRQAWADSVTFPTEAKAQAWIDEQVRRERSDEK